MHAVLAGAMAVGVFLFTIGAGLAVVSHSEVDALIRYGSADMSESLDSLNDRDMRGVFLAAFGVGIAAFALLIQEAITEKEKQEKENFFY
ncbi:MAG: hypothetical protein JW880_04270 [Candidatus Thermoplasmatota archaeon]|nr:hypothetical protein [Candidatus Thermoplasmatota archaeon]